MLKNTKEQTVNGQSKKKKLAELLNVLKKNRIARGDLIKAARLNDIGGSIKNANLKRFTL